MIRKVEKDPECHQIEGMHINIPGDGCLSVIANAIRGVRNVTIFRGKRVFLGRTDQEEVYSCPVRTLGVCNLVAPCKPEHDVKVVDADIDHSRLLR